MTVRQGRFTPQDPTITGRLSDEPAPVGDEAEGEGNAPEGDGEDPEGEGNDVTEEVWPDPDWVSPPEGDEGRALGVIEGPQF